MNTYYGKKNYMTQAWGKSGKRFAATVVKIWPLKVTQHKSLKTDGYNAIQVGFGSRSKKNITKPLAGHLKKNLTKNAMPLALREIKTSAEDSYKVGDTIDPTEVLSVGDTVTVSGISKGRGFAGVIKRWGFSGGPRTHGQSDRERAPGSIGQGTDPGRVHKGKKMPGRFGNQKFSIKNLTIIHLDENELVLSGPIPGSRNSIITITKIRSGDSLELLNWNKKETSQKSEQITEKKEATPKAKKDDKTKTKDSSAKPQTQPSAESNKETK